MAVPVKMSETAVWDDVTTRVRASMKEACIVYIERVVTPALTEAFAAYTARLGPSAVVDWVWHGTTQEASAAICRTGFDPGRNVRAAYGPGTYFARDASHSLTGFAPAGKDALCHVFLCKTAYSRTRSTSHGCAWDEVGGAVGRGGPTIYAVPRAEQCVPVYLVAFYRGK